MDVREKLVELLFNVPGYVIGTEGLADHLIANGVTLDNQVSSSKWISVKDRLPTEEDAFDGGFVIAYTAENRLILAKYQDVCRFNEFVVYWMPLRLSQPPKGE